MISTFYQAQIELLLRVLPHIAAEDNFALKGGTAINLFYRDLPRLSVDIDLTYLPNQDRQTALEGITNGLAHIRKRLETGFNSIQINTLVQQDGHDAKLICKHNDVQIKVEANTIVRGYMQPPRFMPVCNAVQDKFKLFAAAQVIAKGELYGGKICAALDRQHPRDLFDIRELFSAEGITDEIRLGFIAALMGHNRPIHELLRPNFRGQQQLFDMQFKGMALKAFTYDEYKETWQKLIAKVSSLLTENEQKLLLGFKSGEPNWSLYPLPGLGDMAAIKWKLQNIRALRKKDPAKHEGMLRRLSACFEQSSCRPSAHSPA